MKTLKEYLQEQEKLCIDNSIKFSNDMIEYFKKEWFDLLCEHLKQGNTITQEIFDSLEDCQKWYLNKHYSIHGIKIVA